MASKGKTSTVMKIDDLTYLDFYQNCVDSYLTAKEDHAFRRYPDCYFHMYDVLEFFWKALSILSSGRYDKTHLPDKYIFTSLMRQFNSHINKTESLKLEQIFTKYNPTWTTMNPSGRKWSRYGKGNKTPYEIINQQMSLDASEDSRTVAIVLARINRELRVASGTLQVGILDGRFSPSDPLEKVCNISVWGNFSSDPLGDWSTALSAINHVKVTRIAVLELSSKYQVVVNPFGEIYPDLPKSRNVLPGYTQIRSFIGNGGIFVTAGGHPFTYFYDVTTGTQTDVKRVIKNVLLSQPSLIQIPGGLTVSLQTSTAITDNLLNMDFDSETTWDVNQSGPIQCKPFQNPIDLKYWKYSTSGPLNEFRSIDPKQSKRATPVVRGQRSDGKEVYLASLLPYGLGYLYHFGVDLSRSRMTEFDFVRQGVEALCTSYLQYYS